MASSKILPSVLALCSAIGNATMVPRAVLMDVETAHFLGVPHFLTADRAHFDAKCSRKEPLLSTIFDAFATMAASRSRTGLSQSEAAARVAWS